MTLIYGRGFWDTLNVFVQGITYEKEITNYSFILVSCYIIIHLIIGLFIGLFISKIPKKLLSFIPNKSEIMTDQNIFSQTKRSSKKSSFLWLIALAVLSVIYCLSTNNMLFSAKLFNQIIGIIFRSSIILIIWKFIIGPYMIKYLRKYLMSTSKKYQYQIEAINNVLPEMKHLLNEAWLISKEQPRFKRLKYFILHVLYRTVYDS
jgi:flagellar biosynthesis protein FliQ